MTIDKVPFAAVVNVTVSSVSPVITITLPFMDTSSTTRAVRVPSEVMFVWAAVPIAPLRVVAFTVVVARVVIVADV